VTFPNTWATPWPHPPWGRRAGEPGRGPGPPSKVPKPQSAPSVPRGRAREPPGREATGPPYSLSRARPGNARGRRVGADSQKGGDRRRRCNPWVGVGPSSFAARCRRSRRALSRRGPLPPVKPAGEGASAEFSARSSRAVRRPRAVRAPWRRRRAGRRGRRPAGPVQTRRARRRPRSRLASPSSTRRS
jgi:hypothetical protein